LLFALALGCAEPRTQLMVRIGAGPELRSRINEVRVTVEGGPSRDALAQVAMDRAEADHWPLILPIVPLGGDASRVVRVTAEASDPDARTFVARVITGFASGRTIAADLLFTEECADEACTLETTCSFGSCVDAYVAPSELPEHEPRVDPGDGGVDAGPPLPNCGDGDPDEGEACDDGDNDGRYGGCNPGCRTRAPYCGDGERDELNEECDETAPRCLPSCDFVPIMCNDAIARPGELCPVEGALLEPAMAVPSIELGDFDGAGEIDIAARSGYYLRDASGAYTHIRTLQAMSPEQLASFGLGPGWEADMAANMGVPWPPPGEPAEG
jgi:hypothetical protein